MIEITSQSTDNPRYQQITQWLAQCIGASFELKKIPGDASFREYWRVESGADQFILMDAPVDKENSTPFIQIGEYLLKHNVPVPHIFHHDLTQGFVLLEDLGDVSLYAQLCTNENMLEFKGPIQCLHTLASLPKPQWLPVYSAGLLKSELLMFDEWFLRRYAIEAGLFTQQQVNEFSQALATIYPLLVESALNQPQVFVHKDFICMNIHIDSHKNFGIGLIDFQDGLWGPVTYDLVSLLQDRYITWPKNTEQQLVEEFRQGLGAHLHCQVPAKNEFYRDYEWMGLQRNLRILGVYARLALRDKKLNYLPLMPRFWGFCQYVVHQWDEFAELRKFMQIQL